MSLPLGRAILIVFGMCVVMENKKEEKRKKHNRLKVSFCEQPSVVRNTIRKLFLYVNRDIIIWAGPNHGGACLCVLCLCLYQVRSWCVRV